MAKYALIKNNLVVNVIELEQGADWSPPSGHTLMPLAEAAGIPRHVEPSTLPGITKSQLRIYLQVHGLTQAVLDAINALPEPPKTEALIRWDCTMVYERDHPLVAAIGQMLGMSSEDVDTLFTEASVL